jgi:hypothetical protein
VAALPDSVAPPPLSSASVPLSKRYATMGPAGARDALGEGEGDGDGDGERDAAPPRLSDGDGDDDDCD